MSDRIIEGRRAYEADVKARPVYHDGKPRPTWLELSVIARWSWMRPTEQEGGKS